MVGFLDAEELLLDLREYFNDVWVFQVPSEFLGFVGVFFAYAPVELGVPFVVSGEVVLGCPLFPSLGGVPYSKRRHQGYVA